MATRTKTKPIVVEVETEEFTPATVSIVAARKVKTVWHIVTHEVTQQRPGRSGVTLDDGTRIVSAPSAVQVPDIVKREARKRKVMYVTVLPDSPSLLTVVCPKHGPVHRNSTLEYAAESAYWHALGHK
jgi:hypothetical protein